MNLVYWILVVILVIGAGALKVINNDLSACQVPKSSTYKVFQ
ncbi:hypothetical protein [Pseudomonas koreensis]|uniref:Uncharacterized protein n=1 Tax=Pseudomonas koreensis TaxID=198620 RepID=A0AA94JGX5_9PSED|nr:hypothetical protein [Pseudomonas koreensis]RVD76831.1 hypothetical protein A9HBioS_3371 [Pseudomonas koreensis]